jgi:hypothetical protein
MNPEVKEKWVAALRSGKYVKTRRALHRIVESDDVPAGYCCLGVLCDLAAQEGIVTEIGNKVEDHVNNAGEAITLESISYFIDKFDGVQNYSYLPDVVAEWAGISYKGVLPHPVIGENGDAYRTLAELNDQYYDNFDDIADVIEEQF